MTGKRCLRTPEIAEQLKIEAIQKKRTQNQERAECSQEVFTRIREHREKNMAAQKNKLSNFIYKHTTMLDHQVQQLDKYQILPSQKCHKRPSRPTNY